MDLFERDMDASNSSVDALGFPRLVVGGELVGVVIGVSWHLDSGLFEVSAVFRDAGALPALSVKNPSLGECGAELLEAHRVIEAMRESGALFELDGGELVERFYALAVEEQKRRAELHEEG